MSMATQSVSYRIHLMSTQPITSTAEEACNHRLHGVNSESYVLQIFQAQSSSPRLMRGLLQNNRNLLSTNNAKQVAMGRCWEAKRRKWVLQGPSMGSQPRRESARLSVHDLSRSETLVVWIQSLRWRFVGML